jgi:DNA transposition AAA+ family ATPase
MIKTFDESTRGSLERYQERHNLTLSEVARELGTNTTQVSKYLNGKPEGDVQKLESTICDILKNESRRHASASDLFETDISRKMNGALEIIRETNDVAVVSGPAGIGKTSALCLYVRENPSAILVTATTWQRNAKDVEGMLVNAISMRGYKANIKRVVLLLEKLEKSNRLIIVDNAHKLMTSGMGWLYDFHDATDCPIALVGNPSIETLIKSVKESDQWTSRTLQHTRLAVKAGKIQKVAERIASQFIGEAVAAELAPQLVTIAEHQGHFRSVKKRALLARKIQENTGCAWLPALEEAHAHSIRAYNL